jgi:dethiobiotin synthase
MAAFMSGSVFLCQESGFRKDDLYLEWETGIFREHQEKRYMNEGFFITGTGTEVGKTLVTGALLRCLVQKGRGLAVKPVQTGCECLESGLTAPDLEVCFKAVRDIPKSLELFCPIRFESPCSPHLAAELEGRDIDFENLVVSIVQKQSGCDWMVVEGAGGLLVPLTKNRTMLDLAGQLGLPIVMVVDNCLGAINHALLSISAVRKAGLPLAGIVMNNTSPPRDELDSQIRRDNTTTIATRGEVEVLAEVPYLPDFSADNPNHWEICACALEGFV